MESLRPGCRCLSPKTIPFNEGTLSASHGCLNLIINNKSNHFILQLKDDQKAKVDEFFKNCYYVKGPYDEESGYKKLNAELEKLGEGKTVVNRLFYLALPPSVFIDASENIKNNCMGTKYVT